MSAIQMGDSGHVCGLSLAVTHTFAEGWGIAADQRGKEWTLVPLHSWPDGRYALRGMGTHARVRGHVTVVDGTLHEVERGPVR